jgi:multidrug efflux pump subunit AcrA (membrane-fusion protein)
VPTPAAGSNGLAAPRTLPSKSGRRRNRVLAWSVALAVLVVGGALLTFYMTRTPSARPDVILHKVKKEDLHVTVTEKGTLESAENKDVVCRVRAGSKGFASTINWVIDDGSKVKKGDLLMILDDSALQDQFRDQKIKVDGALAAKIQAEKAYEITIKNNEKLVAEAENVLLLAQIDLEKFFGLEFDSARTPLAAAAGALAALGEAGDYKRQLDEITGRVRQTEGDVEQNRERSAWADRMVKMKYMSPAQAQAERSRLDSSVESLRALSAQRSILIGYDRKKMHSDFRSKVENAQRALDKEKLAANATEVQAEIDRRTKTSIYFQEVEKLRDIEEQIKECRVYSPQDGMVVYFRPESSRFGTSTQGLIEQGAQVKEGQKMLRIPNLERMMVNTKVHEATVARIKGDVRVPTGIFDAFRAGLMANADPFSRMVSQRDDFLEVIREKYRQHESELASRGQRATIRVDAMSERVLKGHVRTVSAVASQADSWISDVKLYQTYVLIEDEVEGLKPDMTAEVTIHVDAAKEQVLTVPLQAVIGGAEMGVKREVFVRTPTGYDKREVTLGLYNDKMVEVRDGLHEGDEVVINPKVLLGETKTKTRDATGEGNGEKFAKEGEKGGKKGGPGGKKGMGGGPGGPKGPGGPPQ